MKKIIPVAALAALLAGCAGQASEPLLAVHGDGTNSVGYHRASHDRPHAGQWAVAAIGTPFYLAFKTVVCASSIVIAAPAAAVIALADSPYATGVSELGDGVASNCGPPYVLSPS
jgi:hypothetical protein